MLNTSRRLRLLVTVRSVLIGVLCFYRRMLTTLSACGATTWCMVFGLRPRALGLTLVKIGATFR